MTDLNFGTPHEADPLALITMPNAQRDLDSGTSALLEVSQFNGLEAARLAAPTVRP